MALGSTGVSGTAAAIGLSRDADLVISIGCRLTDFTTASKSAFENPDVRFIGINVVEMDAFKHASIPVVADARVTLDELQQLLTGYATSSAAYRERMRQRLRQEAGGGSRSVSGTGAGESLARVR